MLRSGLSERIFSKIRCCLHSRRICLEAALAAALLCSLAAGASFARFQVVCRQVRADTLRLHIVANSDSAQDQALKLRVRDSMLQEVSALFEKVPDQAQAVQTARLQLPRLQAAAERAVRKNGSRQQVRVRLVRMRFPTTHYEGFSLPAGEYDALRIELGKAAGHNWFCVLYPGLCLPSAECAAYPKQAENRLITGKCEVRLALLDWLQKI